MTHEEFVAAYRAGRITARVEREGAARLLSGRLLLPFMLLPLFGLAVAAALSGAVILGIGIFLLTLLLRYAVRSSSQGFVLSRSLADPAFYAEACAAGILRIEEREGRP